jgi:error-prone DNA polymerase
MATLPRKAPERFYDLVVQVAIIRPGPIVGGMVHPYFDRAPGPRAGDLPAPLASSRSSQAHARRAALPGAAPAHRDGRGRLHRRRGRGAAPRDGLQALGRAHGGDRGEAARRHGRARHHRRGAGRDRPAITSFALYGFPESHAASFALIAYASAWLKAHHPGRLPDRAAQRLADGLLPPGDAGQGRAAPRRRGAADRRSRSPRSPPDHIR